MLRATTGVFIATLLCAASAQEAWATNPGRNGSIVTVAQGGSRYMQQHFQLWLFDPLSGAFRSMDVCSVSSSTEPCWSASGISLSPKGQTAAVVAAGFDASTPPKLLTVRLDTGAVSRSAITIDQPWFGIGWDAQGTPLLLPRPTSSDPQQSTVSATAADPDWSSDGRVAFAAGPEIYNGRADIYVGEAGGSFRRVTFKSGTEPSWSPHGRWIAFARNGAVYMVPSSGGKARRIVAASRFFGSRFLGRSISPAWSPDGKRIAFYRTVKRGAERFLDLYTVEWRTQKLRRVAKGLVSDDVYDDSGVDQLSWQVLPAR